MLGGDDDGGGGGGGFLAALQAKKLKKASEGGDDNKPKAEEGGMASVLNQLKQGRKLRSVSDMPVEKRECLWQKDEVCSFEVWRVARNLLAKRN